MAALAESSDTVSRVSDLQTSPQPSAISRLGAWLKGLFRQVTPEGETQKGFCPAITPASDRALKAVVISLGGSRQERMNKQFKAIPGFGEVEFVEGVQRRQLRTRAGTVALLREANLVSSPETEEEAWKCVKNTTQKNELACLLAHLRAMRYALESGAHVIFEDNISFVSMPDSDEAADRIRRCAEASPQAWLRLYGYGGPVEEFENGCLNIAHGSASALALPLFDDDGRSKVWGAFAYMVSKSAYETLVDRLAGDMPQAIFQPRGRRKKGFNVRPLDHLLPNRCLPKDKAHLPLRVMASSPCCYRAPMLRSTIHTEYDTEYTKTVEAQMKTNGTNTDTFDSLWLSDAERESYEHFKNTRQWVYMGENVVVHKDNYHGEKDGDDS